MIGQCHEPFSAPTVTDFVYHHVADETVFFSHHKSQYSAFIFNSATTAGYFKGILSFNASIAMYAKVLVEFPKHMG